MATGADDGEEEVDAELELGLDVSGALVEREEEEEVDIAVGQSLLTAANGRWLFGGLISDPIGNGTAAERSAPPNPGSMKTFESTSASGRTGPMLSRVPR